MAKKPVNKKNSLSRKTMKKTKGGQGTISLTSQEIVSPRDPQSGLPTGMRQHEPYTITDVTNPSSPTSAPPP
jgi:hypothetical protein